MRESFQSFTEQLSIYSMEGIEASVDSARLFFAKGVVFGNQGTIEKRAGASLGLSSGMLARLTAIPRWKTSECLEVIRDTNQAIFSLVVPYRTESVSGFILISFLCLT